MRRRLAPSWLVAVWALITAWALAVPAGADPPIWRVRGPHGAPVVLFGSVHVLDDHATWRTPALASAIASADTVWFEVDNSLASRAQGAQIAARLGRLPRGTTLSAYLPRGGRALLERTAARVGLPMQQLQTLRPWYAEVLLSVADLQRQGARQGLGVEEQIATSLPASARRRALETAADQIGMLANQPMRDQVASLMATMREMERDPNGFVRLQKAWVDGDVGWIQRQALSPMKAKTPRLYARLVVERNRRWVSRIERLLNGSEQALIVVGVGHLIGPDGVPAMLRRKGFVVEGP